MDLNPKICKEENPILKEDKSLSPTGLETQAFGHQQHIPHYLTTDLEHVCLISTLYVLYKPKHGKMNSGVRVNYSKNQDSNSLRLRMGSKATLLRTNVYSTY